MSGAQLCVSCTGRDPYRASATPWRLPLSLSPLRQGESSTASGVHSPARARSRMLFETQSTNPISCPLLRSRHQGCREIHSRLRQMPFEPVHRCRRTAKNDLKRGYAIPHAAFPLRGRPVWLPTCGEVHSCIFLQIKWQIPAAPIVMAETCRREWVRSVYQKADHTVPQFLTGNSEGSKEETSDWLPMRILICGLASAAWITNFAGGATSVSRHCLGSI